MFWFILSIYLVVVFIGIAIINRYNEDHPYFDYTDTDYLFDASSYDLAILGTILWPISVPIFCIVTVIYCIYKGFYYVVDKIYTKILSHSGDTTEERRNND